MGNRKVEQNSADSPDLQDRHASDTFLKLTAIHWASIAAIAAGLAATLTFVVPGGLPVVVATVKERNMSVEIRDPSMRDEVPRCVEVSGNVNAPKGWSLWVAYKAASIPDGYVYSRVLDGPKSGPWTVKVQLGGEGVDKNLYDIFAIMLNAEDSQFLAGIAGLAINGSAGYFTASGLPPGSRAAKEVQVRRDGKSDAPCW